MTPWQTVLQRAVSSAGLAVPQASPAEGRLIDADAARPALAVGDFVRSLSERAVLSFRWLQQKSVSKFSSRRMRVTETVSLGEKRFVTILQVDGQQLLIGSATGQVTLLAVLDDKQSAGSAKGQSA